MKADTERIKKKNLFFPQNVYLSYFKGITNVIFETTEIWKTTITGKFVYSFKPSCTRISGETLDQEV